MADQLSGPITDLVDLLTGAGLTASTDPGKLNLPGAWVTLDQVRVLTLAGQLRLECSVFLISPDTDDTRAIGQLAAMLDQLLTIGRPDGPVVTQGVVMPADTTPLPALRVPFHLHTGEPTP